MLKLRVNVSLLKNHMCEARPILVTPNIVVEPFRLRGVLCSTQLEPNHLYSAYWKYYLAQRRICGVWYRDCVHWKSHTSYTSFLFGRDLGNIDQVFGSCFFRNNPAVFLLDNVEMLGQQSEGLLKSFAEVSCNAGGASFFALSRHADTIQRISKYNGGAKFYNCDPDLPWWLKRIKG